MTVSMTSQQSPSIPEKSLVYYDAWTRTLKQANGLDRDFRSKTLQ